MAATPHKRYDIELVVVEGQAGGFLKVADIMDIELHRNGTQTYVPATKVTVANCFSSVENELKADLSIDSTNNNKLRADIRSPASSTGVAFQVKGLVFTLPGDSTFIPSGEKVNAELHVPNAAKKTLERFFDLGNGKAIKGFVKKVQSCKCQAETTQFAKVYPSVDCTYK